MCVVNDREHHGRAHVAIVSVLCLGSPDEGAPARWSGCMVWSLAVVSACDVQRACALGEREGAAVCSVPRAHPHRSVSSVYVGTSIVGDRRRVRGFSR